MAQAEEQPVSGEFKVRVKANLRQGAPSLKAPVLRKLSPDSEIMVSALAVGDSVDNNRLWYRTSPDNAYIWSGAVEKIPDPDPTTPATPPQTPRVEVGGSLNKIPLVVDIYHGDGVKSFDEAYAAGLRGVIHKSSTGASGVDDAYAARRALAVRAGLLWGAFHWGTAAPASDQADHFLKCADPDKDTLVALDFEKDVGNQMTLDGAREFLNIINTKLGRKAVLYSGDTVKSALGKKADAFFGSHRLWLAQYSSIPVVQRSWKNYWLWQYTDGQAGPGRKSVPGIPGNRSNFLDCDYFDETADDLKTQWAS
jgi:GH25 family lysozyme M1 (1,4-beta-N-acetylmuramidase)